ncbi:MAG: trehalose-6-phosphate synthase [Gammaproteobacteria bacterium]|jgi:trehalose 6-phosphate synthase
MENVTSIAKARAPDRLIVVSNRLPVVFKKNNDTGDWSSRTGSGGLVSALMPVLRDRGGIWVGWPGVRDNEAPLVPYLKELSEDVGYGLEGVYLSDAEIKGFYEGFSNQIIWPLFHDLPVDCHFRPEHWETYRAVNRKFIKKIAEIHQPSDLIWVHDYHLIGVAAGLRSLKISNRIGFFLHIPFPPPDLFLKLPWRMDILSGLLEYDLIGFQTMRDCRNFQRCLRALYKVKIKGKGHVQRLEATPLGGEAGDRRPRSLRVGSFPISIDFYHYEGLATSEAVVEELGRLRQTHGDRQMILSVDRLDYTKGLLDKLRAFRLALERYPELHERCFLSLHVVPSRENIPEYHRLRIQLEQLTSEINGAWSRPGWIPIHYYYHSLSPTELMAYYRRAEIMLITALKDGMNLVAKEYCACHPDNDGILMLSEFAGAAAELQKGALLINPYDAEGTAHRIYEAMKMDPASTMARMRRLRRQIRRYDIYHWVNSYLQAIAGRDLEDFPKLEDYVPGPPPETQALQS